VTQPQYAQAVVKARSQPGGEAPLHRSIEAALHAAVACTDLLPVIDLPNRRILGYAVGDGSLRAFWLPLDRPVPLDCAISSYNNIIAALSSGSQAMLMFQKRVTGTTLAVNFWYDFWPIFGAPASGAYPGAAYTATAHTDTEIGAIYHGGNVSPNAKYLVSDYYQQNATTAFGQAVVLYDRVLTYEACSFNANVQQNMTNVVSIPRYSGQNGVRIVLTTQTATGATASNLTQLSYGPVGGGAAHVMPIQASMALTFNPSTVAPAAEVPSLVQTTNAYPSLYLPLATGDGGVQSITSFTTSAANTGTLCFVLARPLAYLTDIASVQVMQRDLVMGFPTLARIYDGACLSLFGQYLNTSNSLLIYAGTAAWG
jgi:hypothetical protein